MIFRSQLLRWLMTAFLLFAAGSPDRAEASQRYRIEVIGPPPSRELRQSVHSIGGLNDLGEVAFNYSHHVAITSTLSQNLIHSYLATASGIIPIPDLGGPRVMATDLTDTGLVVGGASSADTYLSSGYEMHYQEPFVYTAGQTVAIALPGRGSSFAAAANNRGEIVGRMDSESSGTGAFKWSEAEGYVDLGNFGADYVHVTDINERSDILLNLPSDEVLQHGETYSYNGMEAVIYNAGSIERVPSSKFGINIGWAINDGGVVVGEFGSVPGSESHAFIWDPTKGFRDLGLVGEHSYATGVNNAGVVIGAFADTVQQSAAPFVYTEADGRRPLVELIDNLAGWTSLESAAYINDRGQIVGFGQTGYGFASRRIYLATPIPEPASLTAAVLVVACLAATSRGRRGCRRKVGAGPAFVINTAGGRRTPGCRRRGSRR